MCKCVLKLNGTLGYTMKSNSTTVLSLLQIILFMLCFLDSDPATKKEAAAANSFPESCLSFALTLAGKGLFKSVRQYGIIWFVIALS